MTIINAIGLISAVLLIAAILLQSRGTGLGAAFGGEGNVYRTKRGLEKSLFRATIVLAVVFLGASLATTLAQPDLPTPELTPADATVPLEPASTAAPLETPAAADVGAANPTPTP